jgi:heme exporter protein A
MSRLPERLTLTDLACLRGERLVFAGLGLAVAAGGAVLLTGPNGSGKSTLLRLLAGLLPAFRGTVAWDGTPVDEAPDRHRGRVAYVGHADAVKPAMTVRESIAFWAGMAEQDDAGSATVIEDALRTMDIAHLADVPGRLLSAGQKRRTNLARLFAMRRPLWLLDEPTVALDRASVERLEAGLAAHRAAGGLVIASTHAPIALPGAATLAMEAFAAEPV